MESKKHKIILKLNALCGYAGLSKNDKLNLSDIFDNFHIAKLPAVLDKFFWVSSFYFINFKKGETVNIKLEILSPTGKDVSKSLSYDGENEIKITKDSQSINFIVNMIGFQVNETGQYKFNVYIDNKIRTTYYLNVITK